MKKVEAIIRSDKLEDLKNALTGSGLAKGMTVSQVLGYGNQRGFAEFVRGQRIVPTLLAKVKVEIVVKDMAVDEVVDAIRSAVATGEVMGRFLSFLLMMLSVFVLVNVVETPFNIMEA